MSAPVTAAGWSCDACATLFPPAPLPPQHCPVCEDERQYVHWEGQRWTPLEQLTAKHGIEFRDESGITTLGLAPGHAINQRAFLLPHGDSNMLWECLGVVTEAAVAEIHRRGGLSAIAISHPHFYSAMTAWSDAFGGIPIYLHVADRDWVMDTRANVIHWEGEQYALGDGKTLIHLPVHFPGSSGLHWQHGPRGAVLFPGDALQVTMDRRHVSCMYSYPNAIPLGIPSVQRLANIEAPLDYVDVYGFTWGRQILGDAKACVQASFARQLRAMAA